jgi:chromosome condensin MukBEF MukE localization factor
MKRLFWLGLGVTAGVALTRKATQTARQATPAGLASNLGDAVGELAGAIGSFGADVRAGMSEREQELRDMVDKRSGTTSGRAAPVAPAARTRPARARRAEG